MTDLVICLWQIFVQLLELEIHLNFQGFAIIPEIYVYNFLFTYRTTYAHFQQYGMCKKIVLCNLWSVRNMLPERMVWVSFCKSANGLFLINIINDIFMALHLIDMLPLSLKDLCFQSTSLMGCQFQVSLTLYGICFISL